MKKNLNEEITNIRTIMGLEEQKIWDKVKNVAQNVGTKIQTGVNQVAQKITDKTQPQQPQPVQQNTNSVIKEYNDFVEKWKVVNDDPKSNMVFIESNDHGNGDSYHFKIQMKYDALRIYAQRYMKLNPDIKVMYNKFEDPIEIDSNCYMKPDQTGKTIVYCAGVYKVNLKN